MPYKEVLTSITDEVSAVVMALAKIPMTTKPTLIQEIAKILAGAEMGTRSPYLTV